MPDNIGQFDNEAPLQDPRQRTPVSEFDHPEGVLGRRAVDINRLSEMRSYSYFFSLVLCRTTEIAETLAQQTNVTAWQHPTGPKEAQLWNVEGLEQYAPRALDGGNTSNDYCVLIFGATDAAFAITDVTWMSVTAGEAVPGDAGTSIAVEGNIKVSEPRGILFVDQVIRCCQALGVDASMVTWMLKPFFVGYAVDPNTRQDIAQTIADVRPLMFIPYDLTGVYTEQGGTYDLSFVGLANGATRLPQYSRAADGFALQVGPSLRDAMQQLQIYINDRYTEYKNCFEQKLHLLDGTNFVNTVSDYLPVEYIILLDPVYCNERYLVTDRPQQYRDTVDCEKGKAYVKQTIGGSIESAIRGVMQLSPQILEEMAGVKDGKGSVIKYEYKVQTALRALENKVQIVYTIKQFVSPKAGLVAELVGGKSENERVFNDKVISDNLTIFDYIYTGLNTDILEFDLKLNLGMAYMQTATSANSFKQQLEAAPSSSTHINPNAEKNRQNPGQPLKIPLYFGAQAQRRGLNTMYPGENIGANYTMAKHASLEVAEATVKIRGNTAFLHTASEMSNPDSVFRFLDAVVRDKSGNVDVCSAQPSAPAESQGEIRGMSMGDFPMLAKLNIKMPADQDDLQAFRDRSNYAANFWFQGYYYIYAINHEFTQGEFNQTLNMIALPDPGTFAFLNDKRRSAVAFTEQIVDCFGSTVPCQQPKPSADGQPDTRTANDSLTAQLECPQEKAQQMLKAPCGTGQPESPPTDQVQRSTVVNPTPVIVQDEAPQLPTNDQEQKNLYAFRHAIAKGEGTLTKEGTINYRKIVNPGTECSSLDDHPAAGVTPQLVVSDNFRVTAAKIVSKIEGLTRAFIDTLRGTQDTTNKKVVLPSSAAGGYQIVLTTWNAIKAQLGLTDFGADSQDQACEQIFKNFNAFNDIKAGRIVTAVNKLKSQWASLPGAYAPGQRQVSMQRFIKTYESFGGVNIETIS